MFHISKRGVLASTIVLLSIIAIIIYNLPFIPYKGLIFMFVYCPIVVTLLIYLGDSGLRQKNHQL